MYPETDTLLGEIPYVCIGDGPRTLVVLPGVGDAIFDGDYPPFAEWVLQAYFASYRTEYTVIFSVVHENCQRDILLVTARRITPESSRRYSVQLT